MALTQMQLIQSLGEALAWLEREVSWGVPPTELRHLCGRIGELYACVMTNGQMASGVNQKGYDVVSANNERISVKTTAMRLSSNCQFSFNPKTLKDVDRIMLLRVDVEEAQVEILYDGSIEDTTGLMRDTAGRRVITISQIAHLIPIDTNPIEKLRGGWYDGYQVCEYENGGIEVYKDSEELKPTKTALRKLATMLGVSMFNSNGNPYNTRQLGSLVIDAIDAM